MSSDASAGIDAGAGASTAAVDPFAALPGAVGAPPLHYGNPLGEQRALAAGRAIVDLSDRAVLTITGPDRLTWLDSLTSQSVARLAPGESAETLLLDPTGRLEYSIRLVDDGETLWLLVDGDEGSRLLKWLERMRFMLRVELADRTPDFATVGAMAAPGELPALPESAATSPTVTTAGATPSTPTLSAPATSSTPTATTSALPPALAEHAARSNGVVLEWVDPWTSVQRGGHQYATVGRHPATDWSYREVLVPRAEFGSLASLAGAPGRSGTQLAVAGTLALEALRIAAWRPRRATEVDERTIPHELDWLRSAVHLAKGCYRGQETVAKVHNLGHPPRRLVMLHLDGSEGVLPEPGSPVLVARAATSATGPAADTATDPAIAPATDTAPGPATDAAIAPATDTAPGSATDTATGPMPAPATGPVTHAASGSAPGSSAELAADARALPPGAIGTVTSSALHFELGPIALAVIKRSTDPAADLTVLAGDVAVAAAQETIVPTDAGAEANVPRIPRLGAVRRA